jgi:hypothetical protein
MTNEQEIRAKALEIAIKMFSLFPPNIRMKALLKDGQNATHNIAGAAAPFEKLIRETKP